MIAREQSVVVSIAFDTGRVHKWPRKRISNPTTQRMVGAVLMRGIRAIAHVLDEIDRRNDGQPPLLCYSPVPRARPRPLSPSMRRRKLVAECTPQRIGIASVTGTVTRPRRESRFERAPCATPRGPSPNVTAAGKQIRGRLGRHVGTQTGARDLHDVRRICVGCQHLTGERKECGGRHAIVFEDDAAGFVFEEPIDTRNDRALQPEIGVPAEMAYIARPRDGAIDDAPDLGAAREIIRVPSARAVEGDVQPRRPCCPQRLEYTPNERRAVEGEQQDRRRIGRQGHERNMPKLCPGD